MADRHVDHLLIGGGIASASAAATLRAEGATGSILLAGRELDPPYHRPPITKALLRGTETKEQGFVALPDDVEVLTRTNVLALDVAAKTVTLQSKEVVSFGTALVATGAMVRRLPLDGSDKDGIHYLRAPMNAAAVRRDLEEHGARQVVCVGGSYIGCEVAASLASLGLEVTVLMQEDEPLERGFGAQAGAWVRRGLEARGVTVRGGVDVHAFTGTGERVEGVVLAGDETVPAQAVVCGVGAIPDVMLARKSGLPIGELGGVACDASLKAVDGIWAAGDMCEYPSVLHGRTLRVEHEDHAAQQGAHVARAMLGHAGPYATVPYFWSDLGDWATLEYVGPAYDWATEELVGSTADDRFGIRYLDAAGRLLACLSVNGGADLDAARHELAERAPRDEPGSTGASSPRDDLPLARQ